MLKVKRNVLSVALASAIAVSSGHAMAQDAATQTAEADAKAKADAEAKAEAELEAATLDTVEVTGIRAAIEQSIETKQSSTSIVEAISAEDIGKLPDTSIADSLARLPGLSAQRFGNRPQEINIRGFAGDFSTALLNGREQVSLGNNRGVEFDQYPSELTHQVVVYKTPDASLVGQGLSGTVDLRTVRPLEYGERVFALNARADVNDLDEKTRGYRASISYIDQFADDTIGLALGYAHLDNPAQAHTFGSWGYDGGVIQGAEAFDIEGENERDGFMAVLEYKPSDRYTTTLDAFYSKFDKEETKRGFQFSLQSWTGAVLNGRTDAPSGTATTAEFSNVNFGVIRNDFNAAYDDLLSVGWNNEYKINDAWTLNLDLSHSSAKREERILETYARLAPGVSTDVTATFNPDGFYEFDFGLDLTDPANFRLMDPGGWGGSRAQAGYLKDFEVEDELDALRLDFNYDFAEGPFTAISFGFNVTDRTKSRSSIENTLCTTAGCVDNTPVAIPSQYITDTSLNFAGMTFLGLDPLGLLNGFYIPLVKDNPDIDNKNWEVNEDVRTLFVQADFDTDLGDGDVRMRGNFGLQIVDAEQSSSGIGTFNGVALDTPARRGGKNTSVLPSLNVSFQVPWDQYIRFGAARQMARPRMDDLRANSNFGYDNVQQEFSGGGGNPELDPWIANAYDVSYEKYFQGNKGYVSLAYFYKDLKTYIYNDVDVNFDFSTLGIPTSELPPNPPSYIGTFTKPTNGQGGTIKGFEFAVSIPFELLWAPLEGFGFQGNYSDTSSSIAADGPGTSSPLPGLSKYVSNMTLYYDRYGFQARVSQRHRSEFLGEVQGFGGDRTRINFGGETVTDVQLGYTLQSGPLKDLSILVQVNNLENEPFLTNVAGFSDRPNSFSEFGRTYLFGVNYKF